MVIAYYIKLFRTEADRHNGILISLLLKSQGQKLNHMKKVCLRFKLFKKTVHKNNPRMHSPQQNKKVVLTTAAYFKVSTSIRPQRQQPRFVYYCLPKRVFLV